MLNLRKGAVRRLFLFLACITAVSAEAETTCPAERLHETAHVRYVHDGDTVHLEDGRKIRLIGINSPELARDNMPEQAFAKEAREALKTAISAHDNRVGLVYGEERHDRYKRTLAHLFMPDGTNLQALLLEKGLAASIAHPPNVAYSDCYTKQEKIARCAGAGMWGNLDQAIIQADNLTTDNKGFHLVSGEVELVSQTGKGIWIFISELMIGIYSENMAEFNQSDLLSLTGKQLIVRGWLHPKSRKEANKKLRNGRRVKHFMRIRHPSAIEITPTGTITKC
jgi:endonuclease YncB( thermonuclease family)